MYIQAATDSGTGMNVSRSDLFSVERVVIPIWLCQKNRILAWSAQLSINTVLQYIQRERAREQEIYGRESSLSIFENQCTFIHVYVYKHIYIKKCTSIYIYIYIYIHICIHTYMYTYICTYIYICDIVHAFECFLDMRHDLSMSVVWRITCVTWLVLTYQVPTRTCDKFMRVTWPMCMCEMTNSNKDKSRARAARDKTGNFTPNMHTPLQFRMHMHININAYVHIMHFCTHMCVYIQKLKAFCPPCNPHHFTTGLNLLHETKFSETSSWQKCFCELKISNSRISCRLNGVRRNWWCVSPNEAMLLKQVSNDRSFAHAAGEL